MTCGLRRRFLSPTVWSASSRCARLGEPGFPDFIQLRQISQSSGRLMPPSSLQKKRWIVMFDVVIIGAGVIGCAIARELTRYQLSLAVFDQASDVCEGTSKANSGIVHAGYDATPGTNKARYNVRGNPLVYQWAQELAVPCKNNTSLVLAFSESDLPRIDALIERGQQNGVKGLSRISREEVLRREPLVNPAVAGALLAETGGIVSPYGLTIALAEHAAVNGADFHLDCQVLSLVHHPGPDVREAHFVVQTTQGPVQARSVINAAGVFADSLHNRISQDQLTITARRGEYYMLDKRIGAQFTATLFQLPTNKGKGILVTPTVEQTLILGPTSDTVPDKTDTRTTAAKLEEILTTAALTWPGLRKDSFITSFAGLRAHLAEGDFRIGRSLDVPGYYLAAGIES
ncbi:MAG: NAD(P)/FAD-dependent oxidoreductase, partial [Clostridia bacterium]|nr:NAD(P)/FAD-dependent oxidoreductase [Clostridia bacterium]